MSIQVKNWSVFFEKYPVLHNIDLEFNGQGIFAVIGPSGCGKTTLLKSINRTAELDRGFNCSGNNFQSPCYRVKRCNRKVSDDIKLFSATFSPLVIG
jgi:ABC-type phosphate transport system ATPase subunit